MYKFWLVKFGKYAFGTREEFDEARHYAVTLGVKLEIHCVPTGETVGTYDPDHGFKDLRS